MFTNYCPKIGRIVAFALQSGLHEEKPRCGKSSRFFVYPSITITLCFYKDLNTLRECYRKAVPLAVPGPKLETGVNASGIIAVAGVGSEK